MPIKQPDAEQLALLLVEKYGLDLKGESGKDAEGEFIDFRLRDLHPNEGCAIRVRFGWRNVKSTLVPGQWSAELLAEMGLADATKRATFAALAKVAEAEGGQVSLAVNGIKCNALIANEWPDDWKQVQLEIIRRPIVLDTTNRRELEHAILLWGGSLLGMTAALLPLEEVEIGPESNVRGLPEGAKVRIEVNRYERSRLNRAMCISIHGSMCAACSLSMQTKYGELGESYIQVHHVTPVSRMPEGYVVNPITDLVPLCPNCHAMVHRKDPPLTVEELRAAIASSERQDH